MKGFILKSEDETIAVIAVTDKDAFYVNVRTAIAEHFCCDDTNDVSINMLDEDYAKDLHTQEIDVDSIENGEECTRTFSLIETCIY